MDDNIISANCVTKDDCALADKEDFFNGSNFL